MNNNTKKVDENKRNNVHINWFPGHMKKALIDIENRIKVVDVIIELRDARAPISTTNKNLERIINNKPRLIILMKKDLANNDITKNWIKYFLSKSIAAISVSINEKSSIVELKKAITNLGKNKREKELKRGMKPQPVRAMIIGIPNVGKSSLINVLKGSKSASVQNKPGHTKSQQWIKVDNSFELLDTPGVLPMSFDNEITATHVALIGSIKETILPQEILCDELLKILKKCNMEYLKNTYNVEENDENHVIYEKIAAKRGFFTKEGYDSAKAQSILLSDFKNGLIMKISLEEPNDNA